PKASGTAPPSPARRQACLHSPGSGPGRAALYRGSCAAAWIHKTRQAPPGAAAGRHRCDRPWASRPGRPCRPAARGCRCGRGSRGTRPGPAVDELAAEVILLQHLAELLDAPVGNKELQARAVANLAVSVVAEDADYAGPHLRDLIQGHPGTEPLGKHR